MNSGSMLNPQSLNLYVYTENNPIDFTDPSGLFMMAKRPDPQPDFSDLWALIFGHDYGIPDHRNDGDSGGGGGHEPAQQDKRNPCERMANHAQKIANEAIESAKKNGKDWEAALSMFDLSYTPHYIGRIVEDNLATRNYFKSTGGGAPSDGFYNTSEYGQEDFQDKFLDKYFGRNVPAFKENGEKNIPQEGPNKGQWSDQVHHFVAAFSGGINGAFWAVTLHNLGDRWEGNTGDVNLANSAWQIGVNPRTNPEDLTKIGQIIKDGICEK